MRALLCSRVCDGQDTAALPTWPVLGRLGSVRQPVDQFTRVIVVVADAHVQNRLPLFAAHYYLHRLAPATLLLAIIYAAIAAAELAATAAAAAAAAEASVPMAARGHRLK